MVYVEFYEYIINTVIIFHCYFQYTIKTYGIGNRTFGYVQSSYAFLQMCLSPFMGRAADVFGAKTVLLLNACSAALSHLLLGASRGTLTSGGVPCYFGIQQYDTR